MKLAGDLKSGDSSYEFPVGRSYRSFIQRFNMFRSLLLGKLAISVVLSLLMGGYGIYLSRGSDLTTTEYASWLGLGIFFLVLGAAQMVMVFLMLRKRKHK